jgi:hypothetical protein
MQTGGADGMARGMCAYVGLKKEGVHLYSSPFFPPGTTIELMNMPTAMLNGLRSAVDAAPTGQMVCSEIGKIAVPIESNTRVENRKKVVCLKRVYLKVK